MVFWRWLWVVLWRLEVFGVDFLWAVGWRPALGEGGAEGARRLKRVRVFGQLDHSLWYL